MTARPPVRPQPKAKPRQLSKDRKISITISVSYDLVCRTDEVAARMGQTRSAMIALGMFYLLQGDDVPGATKAA